MTKPLCLSNKIWPWLKYDLKVQIIDFSQFLAITKCKFVIYNGFDWYLDKPTLITKPICWVILTWPWPLRERSFQFCFNCQIFFYLFMNLTHTWTKQSFWPNQHVGWFWFDIYLNMTLADKVSFIKFWQGEIKIYPLWIPLHKQTKKSNDTPVMQWLLFLIHYSHISLV